MPLVRKVIVVGGSRAITLPKDWLEYYEKVEGKPIEEVAIEVNKVLKIMPLTPKKAEK